MFGELLSMQSLCSLLNISLIFSVILCCHLFLLQADFFLLLCLLLSDKGVIIPTKLPGIAVSIIQCGGMSWCSWLRHYNTSQKVVGLIPDGVIRISHLLNPSDRTLALGSTQPPTDMSTKECFLGGKGGQYVGLTTLPRSCAHCLEMWEPLPPGILKTYRDCCTFISQCFCDIYYAHSWYKVSMR